MLAVEGLAQELRGPPPLRGAWPASTSRVGEGEFVSVVGPSGCGKTTLLLLLSGLLRPDGGEVQLRRQPRARRNAGRHGDRLPGLQPLAAAVEDQSRQRAVRHAPGRADSARRRRSSRRPACSMRWASPASSTTIPGSCPAACSSASPSRAGSPRSRGCCCSTSRSPRSTRRRAPTCRTSCSASRSAIGQTCVLVTHDVEEAIYMGDRIVVLSSRPTPGRARDRRAVAAAARSDRDARERDLPRHPPRGALAHPPRAARRHGAVRRRDLAAARWLALVLVLTLWQIAVWLRGCARALPAVALERRGGVVDDVHVARRHEGGSRSRCCARWPALRSPCRSASRSAFSARWCRHFSGCCGPGPSCCGRCRRRRSFRSRCSPSASASSSICSSSCSRRLAGLLQHGRRVLRHQRGAAAHRPRLRLRPAGAGQEHRAAAGAAADLHRHPHRRQRQPDRLGRDRPVRRPGRPRLSCCSSAPSRCACPTCSP